MSYYMPTPDVSSILPIYIYKKSSPSEFEWHDTCVDHDHAQV